MNSIHAIYKTIKEFVVDLYSEPSLMDAVVLQDTKKEHEGDITLIAFSIVKFTKKNPQHRMPKVKRREISFFFV